jgi:uncharacterized membrane protein YsdA (DUF1294 family)
MAMGKWILLIWLVGINLAALIAMGWDKSRAKRGVWRIKEATLFLLALLGGGLGANLGMQLFRHKTKHWYFVVGMPLILVAQIALAVFIKVYFCSGSAG